MLEVMLPLLLALAPHVERLPVWLTLSWLACAAGAYARARWRRPGLPPQRAGKLGAALRLLESRTLKLLLALAGVAGVLLQYGTVIGPSGGIALLVFLSGVKLLELEGPRDRLALLFVGCFLLTARFLDAQGLPTAAWMTLAALSLVAGMAAVQNPTAPWREHGALAAKLMLLGLPVALLLFLLFPRISGPLWSLPHPNAARTGLSDIMAPGRISRLIQSDELVFRAEFAGAQPDSSALYWRGPVLWDFDGFAWRIDHPLPAVPPVASVRGAPTHYSVTLEPHQRPVLLGMPEHPPEVTPPIQSRLGPDLHWQMREPAAHRLRYEADAWLDFSLDPELTPGRRARALALPDGGNPRARALARDWRQRLGNDAAIVEAALTMIRTQGYAYTLTPPTLGADAVDEFLFATRRGFCEHYAGAFVFLMRAAGTPARVVTGYQGGELNPLGRYWIIRGRDAHAWAEVWLAGRGWVRTDPTAAVAPFRVERGIQAALPAGERVGGGVILDGAWMRPLALGWDLVNNHWNQWVLGYNQERQRQFLARLAPWLTHGGGIFWGLGAGAGLLALAALWRLWPRGAGGQSDPASRAYARFCARLARRGLARSAAETPEAYARRVADQRPDLALAVDHITALYLALRYGGQGAAKDLHQAVKRFRPS
ncbi:MAG: DUF3488 domain-containing transglutaminase family protein [Betaproteobacteria bacterium]|nr:DUF3488 domain-containing transglutaminase family protein [Betaproteobacteria bacterium]